MGIDKKWIRGGCCEMALALHEKTGQPVWGLYSERSVCQHAFVWDEQLGMGIDGRGMMSLDRLRLGCAGQNARPMNMDDIYEPTAWLCRPLDTYEVTAAKRYLSRERLLEPWIAARERHQIDLPSVPKKRRNGSSPR